MNTRQRTYTTLAVGLLVIGVAAHRADARRITIKQDLSATGVDPDASGKVQAQISKLKSGMRAKLDLKARRLDPKTTYVVLLNGVKVGTLSTTPAGNARTRFSSQPRRKDQLLGVDPRGMQIEIHNSAGDGVLETHVPEDTIDPTHVRCCLPHDSGDDEQPECEDDFTSDDCTAAGGTDMGAGSCLPNPCAGSTPPPSQDTVACCTPEDDGQPECELRSTAGCSEHHGIALTATSCDPNPCTSTTPSTPETVRCCLADDHETECEHRTAERCAAQGGTDMGPGACSPNPCAAPPAENNIRCCTSTDSGGTECEQRTLDQCTAHGGMSKGPGSCDPNPCG